MSQAPVVVTRPWVEVLEECTLDDDTSGTHWKLWFQWCRYHLDDGDQDGFRFIWKRPDGTLQAARGQARIGNVATILALIALALKKGWGTNEGD